MALSRCRSRESLPSVDDCPRTVPPIPDQGRLDCLGIGGWFPSESPAGLRRNRRLLCVGIRSPDEAGRAFQEGAVELTATSERPVVSKEGRGTGEGGPRQTGPERPGGGRAPPPG